MWGLFALRTRHPPPCSPSVYRGSTRGAGEGVEKNSSVTPCHLLCIKASEWRSWFPQVMNNQIHLFGGQYPLADFTEECGKYKMASSDMESAFILCLFFVCLENLSKFKSVFNLTPVCQSS